MDTLHNAGDAQLSKAQKRIMNAPAVRCGGSIQLLKVGGELVEAAVREH